MTTARQKTKRPPIDVPKLRKSLVWGGPSLLAVVFLFLWIAYDGVVLTCNDILSRAPVVEIVGLAVSAFPAAIFTLAILICGLARASYLNAIIVDVLEKIVLISCYLLGGVMLVSAIVSVPLQNYFMPKLGYTRCDILYGHSSMYSPNRWLKHPQLCILDKSASWVREESEKIDNSRRQGHASSISEGSRVSTP